MARRRSAWYEGGPDPLDALRELGKMTIDDLTELGDPTRVGAVPHVSVEFEAGFGTDPLQVLEQCEELDVASGASPGTALAEYYDLYLNYHIKKGR